MKAFSKKLIELFPLIWKGGDPDEGLKEFVNYKQSIPVRGAALFNENLSKLLLVQGVESPNWSFPRGKISKDEDDAACAVREVKEEIGFDISKYINKEDYIERTIKAKNYRIYLVKGIPEDVDFQPLVRNEIANIEWKDFKRITKKSKSNPNKYFLVTSMIRPISTWIKKNKGEINENQIKKEVETQLKFLLGIGQEEQPTIDPGRELLELIRHSTAKKQLKDDEQGKLNAAHLQHHNQQQQQLIYQQQLQNPLPNFGFQPPPFQQLPFINSFAPPPVPFINGVPTFPFAPPTMPISPFPVGPYPPLPQHHQQQQQQQQQQPQFNPQQQQQPFPQRAPNPEELSRPSQGLRQRNEHETKELLSILNSKPKTKQTNAKELLSIFNKNKNDSNVSVNGVSDDGQQNPTKITMLKRDDVSKEQNGKDYGKNLLALLNKKPEGTKADAVSSPKVEEKVEEKVEKVIEPPKPKLKLLKRDEPIPVEETKVEETVETKVEQIKPDVKTQEKKIEQHQLKVERKSQKPKTASISSSGTHDEEFYESAPPSKELLELIKRSKQQEDEEFEMFEDFTEDEFEESEEDQDDDDDDEVQDSIRSVKDQDETEDIIEPEEFNEIDSEYESDEKIMNEPVPQISKSGSPEIPAPIVEKNAPKTLQRQGTSAPPKKFKILKRGEDLEAPKPIDPEPVVQEERPNTEESNEDGDVSGTSTIQFSDDEEDEEEDESSRFVNETHEDLEDDSIYQNDKTPQPVDDKASNELLSLLNKPKSSESAQQEQSKELSAVEAQDLEEKVSQPVEQSTDPSSVSISTKDKGSNELLSLLHGSNSPEESKYSTPANDLSNSLVNSLQQPSIDSAQVPEVPHVAEKRATSNSLLDLLKNPKQKEVSSEPQESQLSQQQPQISSNQSGAELLGLLHKNKSPEPQVSQIQSQSTNANINANGGADLLNILHRNKSPEVQHSQYPQNSSQLTSPSGTGGAELLSILHSNKSPKPEQQQVQAQFSPQTNSSGLDLLNLLHKNKSTEPQPSQQQQQQQQQQQHYFQHERTGTPANDLLNMLHKKPEQQQSQQTSSQAPSPQSQSQIQEEEKSKSGNSFLEFLMRK